MRWPPTWIRHWARPGTKRSRPIAMAATALRCPGSTVELVWPPQQTQRTRHRRDLGGQRARIVTVGVDVDTPRFHLDSRRPRRRHLVEIDVRPFVNGGEETDQPGPRRRVHHGDIE